MRSLLVHGCYDRATLQTLTSLGISSFAFDLRATSSNLIPFKDLQILLKDLKSEEIILTFQNDSIATVLSFLDLLKNGPFKILLEFRDQQALNYYFDLDRPFLWMFRPTADWRNILLLPKLQGVLLPLEWQSDYKEWPELWNIIEQRNLEIYIHAKSLEEASTINDFSEVNLSLDLTGEIETSYRCVDQDRLKKMQIWRRLNETSAL